MKNTGSCRCIDCAWHRLDRRRTVYREKLENHLAEMVTQANEQLKRITAPEAGVELSYQNYQRGVFSSHLQLVVKSRLPAQANTVEARAKHCAGRVRFT